MHKCKEGEYFCNDEQKCKPIPKGTKVRSDGELIPETAYYKQDSKYQKKLDDEDKRHKEQDRRMKFGKFQQKAKEAQTRLRKGEVKRFVNGKLVSNKD
jgi:hypothetical protein